MNDKNNNNDVILETSEEEPEVILDKRQRQLGYVKKYQDKLESIRVWTEKGKKAEYKEKARAKGFTSLTKYIIHLIEND